MDVKIPQFKKQGLSCPVDFVTVDENRVRFVAFFVLLAVLLYCITGNPVIIAVLLADFILRAFNFNAYSPLAFVSGAVVKQIGLKNKPVDRAPKRFAAFMGVFFLASILLLAISGLPVTSKIVSALVVIFAALESFLGFCAGCYIYSFLSRFKNNS
jgi:hypothetical protein